MKYWEFTEETKVSFTGEVLRRIICTKDFLHAKKGDLGGWLGENAVLKDNAWISDEAQVFGNAEVGSNAWISDEAQVFGNAIVCHDAIIGGNVKVGVNSIVFANSKICDYAIVCDNAEVFNNAIVASNAKVGGTKLFGHAKVIGHEEKIKRGFEEACKPLMKYLSENWHPHVKCLVTGNDAELLSGEIVYQNNDFIVD